MDDDFVQGNGDAGSETNSVPGENDAVSARIHGPMHQSTLRSTRALAAGRCYGRDIQRRALPKLWRYSA
jgi:hypothetical protein